MTPEEVNRQSQERARLNRLRMYLLGGFVVLALLIYGAMLQRQAADMQGLIEANAATTQRMCEQRRANTLKSNENWEGLAVIERHNKFIDDKLRAERLRLYENAKLTVPDCT